MPETRTAPYRLAVGPDGHPCTLVDIAGNEVNGTLWGAVRAGGAFALVVTEFDHFDAEGRRPVTPDAGTRRALADALDDDPNDPHLTVGCRRWEKERADALAADVERCQESIREYAAEADAARERTETAERALTDLRAEVAELIDAALDPAKTCPRGPVGDALHNLRGRAEAAEHALTQLRRTHERELGEAGSVRRGTVQLIRAAVAHEERQHYRRELAQLRHELRGKAVTSAGVALVLGWALGRAR